MDRKAELERKREKLKELKKQREERKAPPPSSNTGASATAPETTTPAAGAGAADVDELVASLIGVSKGTSSETGAPTTAAAAAAGPEESCATDAAAGAPGDGDAAHTVATARRTVELTTTAVQTVADIAPRPVEKYTKECQTTVTVDPSRTDVVLEGDASLGGAGSGGLDGGNDHDDDNDDDDDDEIQLGSTSALGDASVLTDADASSFTAGGGLDVTLSDEAAAVAAAATAPVQVMNDEERTVLESTDTYRAFFERASLMVERALSGGYDVAVDYRANEEEEEISGDGMRLSLLNAFSDERWSRHRGVTSLDISTRHPELFCASYNQNPEAPHEPEGCALVWNTHMYDRPEFVFTCQSPVLSATMAKFHPNLVIGGTYSGQLVLWDNRAKQTPVQRTPLTASSHTHPVYCVSIVGTQNAHTLVTASTDGHMCSWTLDMLSEPQQSLELHHASENRQDSRRIAVTALSFPDSDINNFVVGSEDGNVYLSSRHNGIKAGACLPFPGHAGPVTDVHFHPPNSDNTDLFITSSLDWTVKLWSSRSPAQPIHSFESASDYGFGARWSPTNPALFAAVDGSGHLDMFNINRDLEMPVHGVVVDGAPALNTLRWTHDGNRVITGGSDGRVFLYDVGDRIASARPDEGMRLKQTLKDLAMAKQATEAMPAGAAEGGSR